jgi:hypothetical protein
VEERIRSYKLEQRRIQERVDRAWADGLMRDIRANDAKRRYRLKHGEAAYQARCAWIDAQTKSELTK